ncbi:MAG: hypothetical protein AAF757_28840, partial [Cyanobacteria bacterium P01_D01_bin.116]
MSKSVIRKIYQEQEAMLAGFREKWRSFAISTKSIDEEKVKSIIKATYLVSDFPEPEILFYESPFAAIQGIFAIDDYQEYLGKDIHIKFLKRVVDHIEHEVTKKLESSLYTNLLNKVDYPDFPHFWTEENQIAQYFPRRISSCIENQLIDDFHHYGIDLTYYHKLTSNLTRTAKWAISGCLLNFCISVLNVGHDKKKWQVFQDLIQHCDFIFQFEKVCICCNRPCKLSFDSKNLLHAEGEPAIKFRDGF